MLSDVDGWRILQSLRETGSYVPVQFLTARDNVDDHVKWLELGADDNLVKPFDFAELLARVLTATETTLKVVTYLELNPIRREVTRTGHRQGILTAWAVAEPPRWSATHSLIASKVWGMNFDSDTNVTDVTIRRLREKVDVGFDIKLIHTVRYMGYMLDPLSET